MTQDMPAQERLGDALQELVAQAVLASGRLGTLAEVVQGQAEESMATMQRARVQEEHKFKQAMVAQFEDQQRRLEAALQPAVAWTWKVIGAAAIFCALMLGGFVLLLKHANDRLQVAQERVDKTEVEAEVLEVLQYVQITSCAGRPCLKLEGEARPWKSKQGNYVLLDRKANKKASR